MEANGIVRTFLALSRDAALPKEDWLPMQAVVAGEVEIASDDWDEIVYDFEKVLIVNSLIFFMVIMQYSSEDADNTLGRLEKAAKRRQDYARMRGNTPPAYLLSCWVEEAQPRPTSGTCQADELCLRRIVGALPRRHRIVSKPRAVSLPHIVPRLLLCQMSEHSHDLRDRTTGLSECGTGKMAQAVRLVPFEAEFASDRANEIGHRCLAIRTALRRCHNKFTPA